MKRVDISKIKHVAVRSPNWLGDAVMCAPAVKAVNEIFKPEKLTVLARSELKDFWLRYNFVDEVSAFSRASEGSAHAMLASAGIDALILFTNSLRSAWNGLKTKAPMRLGYSGNFRSLFLTDPVEGDYRLHMTDFYLELLKFRGDGKARSAVIGFPILEEERQFAAELGKLNRVVGIPLGAKYGSAKCWPTEKLKELLKLIAADKRNAVLFGTASEKELGDELSSIDPGIVNLAGKTSIGQMAAVIDICDCIVANDSGPLHIAAAVGKRVIALFGSTDPKRTAPRLPNVKVIKVKADCAPCFKRECPVDFRCMENISARKIFEEINK